MPLDTAPTSPPTVRKPDAVSWLACWRGKGIPDVDVEILSCPGVWNQSITWGGWYEVTLERVWFADHPLCLPASTQTPSKVGPACTMTTSKGLRDCP